MKIGSKALKEYWNKIMDILGGLQLKKACNHYNTEYVDSVSPLEGEAVWLSSVRVALGMRLYLGCGTLCPSLVVL